MDHLQNVVELVGVCFRVFQCRLSWNLIKNAISCSKRTRLCDSFPSNALHSLILGYGLVVENFLYNKYVLIFCSHHTEISNFN